MILKNDLIVGSLKAAQGKKIRGFLNVCDSGDHGKMPITLINGEKEGKTVVITGGTHGGEYPGVETAIRLSGELEPKDMSGNVIIVHTVNVLAFHAKLQYIGPEDGKNLNRMYPGKATGTFTERIAYTITNELFTQADFYMDLHGGDIHEALVPFVIYTEAAKEEVNRVSKEAASLLGIKYVVGSMSINGTFGAAGQMGIPGFLGEIGQCGMWNEAEVDSYMRGCKNVLKYLKVLPGEVEKLGEVVYVPKAVGVNATVSGCFYPFIKPGDTVKKHQKLCEIRDYFGTILATYESDMDGIVLYVISSLPINEGEPIYALG